MSNAELPAYPAKVHYSDLCASGGLTKRELIAAMAMQGALAAKADTGMRGFEGWREEFSRESIRFADALLAELERRDD